MNNDHLRQMETGAADISSLLMRTSNASCHYLVMDKEYLSSFEYPELVRDNHGSRLLEGDAYMVIKCSNGYEYYVNVTADSVLTACAETLMFAKDKL